MLHASETNILAAKRDCSPKIPNFGIDKCIFDLKTTYKLLKITSLVTHSQ